MREGEWWEWRRVGERIDYVEEWRWRRRRKSVGGGVRGGRNCGGEGEERVVSVKE